MRVQDKSCPRDSFLSDIICPPGGGIWLRKRAALRKRNYFRRARRREVLAGWMRKFFER